MSRTSATLIAAALAAFAMAACSPPPETPPIDAPPEPQATGPHQAVQEPLDKARAVEGTLQDAAEQQRATVGAAGG